MKLSKLSIVSLVILLLCSGCANVSEAPTPPSTPADRQATQALRGLAQGDWRDAVAHATVAVAMEPENAHRHLLLGAAHHRGYREGDSSHGVLAEAGYKVALNLEPASRLAVRNLAALYLDQRRYQAAQAALARAVQMDDGDGDALYSLAVASYYARDMVTALWAARQAVALHPVEPAVLYGAAVIHAAVDLPEEAGVLLERYDRTQPTANERGALRKTVERWRRQHERWVLAQADGGRPPVSPGGAVGGAPAGAEKAAQPPAPAPASANGADAHAPIGAPLDVLARDWRDCKQRFSEYDFHDDGDPSAAPASGAQGGTGTVAGSDETQAIRALPAPCKGLPLPRMVLVDVTLISSEDDDSEQHGINVLESLSIVLNGARSRTRAQDASGVWTTTRERTRSIGLPTDAIKYSLNIANAARNRVDVLARPTLVALDRKPSTFFSGADITIPVSGNFNGSLQDKFVGTSLSVTPTMVDEETLLLIAKAARSSIEPINVGTLDQSLVASRNSVSANVRIRYGQSLILSGLRASESSSSHAGVPVLKDTPVLQYGFSKRVKQSYEKNVLIVLTPRRVETYDEILNHPGRVANKDVPDASFHDDTAQIRARAIKEESRLMPNARTILITAHDNPLFGEMHFQRDDLGFPRKQSEGRFAIVIRDLKQLLYF